MTSFFRKFAAVTAVFLFLMIAAQPPAAHSTSSRPRIDTEAWDIKEPAQGDSTSQLTVIFRLTFGQTHQRAFFATMSSQKIQQKNQQENGSGVLTQESRTGHTAASIGAAKAKALTKLLSDFTTDTGYAKPGKYWSCQYPLDFNFAQKTTLRRCREMLTPAHKKSFSRLVSTLSLEYKR